MRYLARGFLSLARCTVLALVLAGSRPRDRRFADELVVDDDAAGVQLKGTWAASTNGSGFVGNGYRFRVAGDGSSSVRWPFPGGRWRNLRSLRALDQRTESRQQRDIPGDFSSDGPKP